MFLQIREPPFENQVKRNFSLLSLFSSRHSLSNQDLVVTKFNLQPRGKKVMKYTKTIIISLAILLTVGLFMPSEQPAEANRRLPKVTFLKSKVPNIAKHIEDAQAAGKPKILTRITSSSKIRSNRSAACGNFSGTGSCDEYPFASSKEGGAGASTRGVPLSEQNSQGGTLSSFYQANGIGDGDKYEVAVQ